MHLQNQLTRLLYVSHRLKRAETLCSSKTSVHVRLAWAWEHGELNDQQVDAFLQAETSSIRTSTVAGKAGLEAEGQLTDIAVQKLGAEVVATGLLVARRWPADGGAAEDTGTLGSTPDAFVRLETGCLATLECKAVGLTAPHLPLRSTRVQVKVSHIEVRDQAGAGFARALVSCKGHFWQCAGQAATSSVQKAVLVVWDCRRASVEVTVLEFAGDFLTTNVLNPLAPVAKALARLRARQQKDKRLAAPSGDALEVGRQLVSQRGEPVTTCWLDCARQQAATLRSNLKAVTSKCYGHFFCFPVQAVIGAIAAGSYARWSSLTLALRQTLNRQLGMADPATAVLDKETGHSRSDITRDVRNLAEFADSMATRFGELAQAPLVHEPVRDGHGNEQKLVFTHPQAGESFTPMSLAQRIHFANQVTLHTQRLQ